jgi:mono/diheme cytochrome c family protein
MIKSSQTLRPAGAPNAPRAPWRVRDFVTSVFPQRIRSCFAKRAIAGLAVLWSAASPLQGLAAAPPLQPSVPTRPPDNLVDPNADPEEAKPSTRSIRVNLRLMDKGHETFRMYCQRCHGIDMVSPGAGFFDLRRFPINNKPRFIASVTHGKRAMPAWGAVLQRADLEALWAYIAGSQIKNASASAEAAGKY